MIWLQIALVGPTFSCTYIKHAGYTGLDVTRRCRINKDT